MGNLIFLYIFGNTIEDLLGHTRYLLFYLVCGLAAVFIQVASDSNSAVPIIGASGAISGVLGAYMLFFPRSRILTLFILVMSACFVRIKAYLFIIFWFAFQFLTGIGYIGDAVTEDAVTENVWAHMSGFACGIVAGAGILYTRGYRQDKKYKALYGTGPYEEND